MSLIGIRVGFKYFFHILILEFFFLNLYLYTFPKLIRILTNSLFKQKCQLYTKYKNKIVK